MQLPRSRGPLRVAVALWGGALAGLPAWGLGSQELEGVDLGRLVLVPQFRSTFAIRENLFRNDDNEPKVDDTVSRLEARIEGRIPFRHSIVRLHYRAAEENYAETAFTRDKTQEAQVRAEFTFGSGDRLSLTERYTKDFAQVPDTAVGSGEVTPETPEDIYRGEPFDLNHWEVELSRTEANQQGYAIRVSREDFNYAGSNAVGLDDFRGFDTSFEYRHPLPGNRWAIAYLGSRRFNYYNNFWIKDGVTERQDPVGVPSRKEETDTVQAGMRGELGPEQQFLFRLGYGSSAFIDYAHATTSTFTGVSGYAYWSAPVGGRSTVDLSLARRPLPSNYETYYVDNEIRAEYRRELARGSNASVSAAIGRNFYGGPVQNCITENTRTDRRVDMRAGGYWRIHSRLGLGVVADYARRRSNCGNDEGDYTASGIEAGLLIGWF